MSKRITLKHATPKRNLAGIFRDGLDPNKSQGAKRVVWLHGQRKSAWKVLHISRRHGVKVEDVVVLTVSVPRDWLRGHGRDCWTCDRLIPIDSIVCINPAPLVWL